MYTDGKKGAMERASLQLGVGDKQGRAVRLLPAQDTKSMQPSSEPTIPSSDPLSSGTTCSK